MVIAHHSSLAYTTFATFNRQHIFLSTAPVVDTARWLFLDYAENFNDVFFMSLMFFISGLFVVPSVQRHGVPGFIRDRFLRLGLPFAFAVLVIMPVAYYASWRLSGRDQGFVNFYERLADAGFAGGPAWFVWLLLAFDACAAIFLGAWRRWHLPSLARELSPILARPALLAVLVMALSAAVYLPMLAEFGFSAWADFLTSPFSYQEARIGLYALWFSLGLLVGPPSNESLLSSQGRLGRAWPYWVAFCIVAYNALVFLPRLPSFQPLAIALEPLLWVVSCVASCFGMLALFRFWVRRRSLPMDLLSRSAYLMYLFHYPYVTWLQLAILQAPLHASIKFLIVFLGATLLSLLTAQLVLRSHSLRRYL